MHIFIKTISTFLSLLAFFTALPVLAAEIRLDAHKSELHSGEQFLLDIVIHSEEPLNTIEGRLLFSDNLLSVKEIRDGDSVINFWIEKPRIEAPGVILFFGITPGGFSGTKTSIFSIVFEAKNIGVASITLDNTKALRNDGLGSQAELATHNTAISVKSGDSNMPKESLTDLELPENFNLTIERDPNIFDGKYFLVFLTQDKISGIDHYEVREGGWGWFSVAESPYLLKHQSLDKKIFVKAIDKVGNQRIAVLGAKYQMSRYRYYVIFGILLVVVAVALFLLKKSWLRFIK